MIMFKLLEDLYIKIFTIIITVAVIFLLCRTYYEWVTPPPYRDKRLFILMGSYQNDFRRLQDYFIEQIQKGIFPPLGVFQGGDPEVASAENFLTLRRAGIPGNSIIVSLDYQSRKLYVGFTDLFFLRDDFPEKFKKDIPKYLLQFSGSLVVQNAIGEPYAGGNTMLALVTILSGDQMSLYY
jgi:hypothetical protein